MMLKLNRQVLFGCVLVTVLLAGRIWYTGKATYAFIAWNIFLAYVPLLVATYSGKRKWQSWKLVLASAIWLVFFPNAPYLITDLYHLSHIKGVPLWYDALMLYVAAYTSVLMGFISLRSMELQWNVWLQNIRLPSGFWNKAMIRTVVVLALFVATGFGIYLGRELRYNSWDIITDPHSLAVDIAVRVLSPVKYFKAWGFTAAYSICLYFFYNVFSPGKRQDVA